MNNTTCPTCYHEMKWHIKCGCVFEGWCTCKKGTAVETKVKYPNIAVQLSGEDGNAFAIMARVITALKGAKVPLDEIREVQADLMAAESYDHLLRKVMATVEVS